MIEDWELSNILLTKLTSAVRAELITTPEYARAKTEGYAREWLNRESLSLAYALAEVVANRIDDLDT